MRRIFGFFILNLKMLLFEKVAFVWSVIFPLFIALVLQKNILDSANNSHELIKYAYWFWAFIIISTFINGIGLQTARLRENGLLKTYTLIAGSKYPIIFGMVLTQIVFSILSLTIFTTILTIIYSIFSLKLFLVMVTVVIISIPFAFASLFLALLPVQISSISTILNILLYPLFIIAINFDIQKMIVLEMFNPFKYIYEIALVISSFLGLLEYKFLHPELVLPFLFYSLVGYLSLKKLNLLSILPR